MTKSDNADVKKVALTHMAKLKRAALTLESHGFPVYGEDAREAADFIETNLIDVAGDIGGASDMTKSDNSELTIVEKLNSAAWVLDNHGYPVSAREVREAADLLSIKPSGPVNNVGSMSDDLVVFHSNKLSEDFNVDDTLSDLDSVQAELDEKEWIHSGRSVRGAAELIRHMLVTVSTMAVNRKGMDMDFKGLETEVKEGRKTITQLQVQGEVADKELMDLRLELRNTLDELAETKALLNQSRGVVGIQLGIVENLAKVLDKVSAY